MVPRRRIWQVVASVLGFCIVSYFLYHTVEGERGLVALMRLQNDTRKAEDTLEGLQQKRKALEHRVRLMKPEGADPDLLEEEARRMLNYSKPNEIVILTPEAEGDKKE